MKIIIKTAGICGKELAKLIEKRLPDATIIGYTDNDANKWNKMINGYKVFSPFKCAELIKDKKADKVIIPMKHRYRYVGIKNMFCELNGLGIEQEDILISSVNVYDLKSDLSVDNAFIKMEDFNYITISYCSTLKCNLNCKRCSVFSPIHKNDYIDTFDDFKKQVLKLKQLIPYLYNFSFLGGEPLLQKDLGKCIKFLHSVYPLTKIGIVTNGILVDSMDDELWDICREEEVSIGISAYPLMFDKVESVCQYLKDKNIDTNISGYRIDFSPMLCKEHDFPYETLENLCNCYTLYRGGITPCGHFHSMKKFNELFATSYEYDDGIVNIFDEKLKSNDIIPRLTKPSKLCDFCNVYKVKVDYQQITSGARQETSKWDYYKPNEQPKAEDWF